MLMPSRDDEMPAAEAYPALRREIISLRHERDRLRDRCARLQANVRSLTAALDIARTLRRRLW